MNQERRDKIVEMLSVQHTIKNTELMEKFGISIETVRRDLAYLEEKGLLQRAYGGAVRKDFLNTEPMHINREQEYLGEKLAIAKEAEKLIRPQDTVFFDLGTTLLTLARNIDSRKNITAFTNALRTAVVLSEKGCDVIVPGGSLRAGELAVSGYIAENTMQQFNVDKAFIGVAGITENGISDFIPVEANLRRQVIKNANKVIVVADYTKFGIRATCNVCGLDDIDVVITDEKAPAKLLRGLEKNGIQVIVAKN